MNFFMPQLGIFAFLLQRSQQSLQDTELTSPHKQQLIKETCISMNLLMPQLTLSVPWLPWRHLKTTSKV